MKRPALLILTGLAAACLADPVGPGELQIAIQGGSTDTVWAGAPGERMSGDIRLLITGGAGGPLPGALLTWTASGTNARTLTPASQSDASGGATTGWLLGTDASEEQRLEVTVRAIGRERQVTIRARAIPHVVSHLRIANDTPAVLRLGDTLAIVANAIDPFGNVFPASAITVSLSDSVIGTALASLVIGGPRRGRATIGITSNGITAVLPLHVTQFVAGITPSTDTLVFSSLGAEHPLAYTVRDDRGRVVEDTTVAASVADTSVAQLTGGFVRAVRTGVTQLDLALGPASASVVVRVQPEPAAIAARLGVSTPIVSVPLDGLVPLVCEVRDRNGNLIDTLAQVVATGSGRWTGDNCENIRGQRSGFDTLSVRLGQLEVSVPVALAIRPVASSVTGDFMQLDSLPAGRAPWAPTARRNSRGEIEVYVAAFPLVFTNQNENRADLHRLVSTDGAAFRYDGVVLRSDDDVCALQGSGIENVSIAPRVDGPGWRMFYAAGSYPCYGWQVFSAVSTDELTWVKESGVRLTNGGTLPPAAPIYPPWPVGEGMITEQLPSGEWRMLVGGYEQIQPFEDRFQVVEWRSPDQLNWTYVGPVLTTRDMPPEAQGTIYSPTIREFAPGMWRMLFSGDDRFKSGWRGRIWSAVSTDKHAWQVEGEVMGSPETRLWYASLVDDLLVLIRQDIGEQRRLATATVVMP